MRGSFVPPALSGISSFNRSIAPERVMRSVLAVSSSTSGPVLCAAAATKPLSAAANPAVKWQWYLAQPKVVVPKVAR
jgi:DNA-binding transcriptional regulator YdaS (Cro superfamily)